MNARTAAAAVACFFLAVRGPAARAQVAASPPGGRVELEMQGCPAVSTAAVRRVLSVEIGDLLLDAPAGGGAADSDRLIIRCAGDVAAVEATGSSGAAPTERILRLDDFPGDAAPRALALLGVELLAARSATVRARILHPRPTVVAPAAPAVESVVRSPALDARADSGPYQARLGLAAVWRTFVTPDARPAFGARLYGSRPVWGRGLAGGDLELVEARKTVENVGEATAALLSGAATLGAFTGGRRWCLAGGLGGRLGLVRESGSSAAPANVTSEAHWRPWGGPTASATLSGWVGRVDVAVGGEAGWSLSSIHEVAAGATAIAIRGPWLAAWMGVGLRL
ncbi:MAG TPA: hypothetical protein VHG72_20690 [Polyangia bacterium]|nr:hypothetical protein [Polyangia bacterium]